MRLIFVLSLLFLAATNFAQKPELILDINTQGNSRPFFIANSGNRTFFSAQDGVNGRELWITDGTADGTKLVFNISPSGNGMIDRRFPILDGKLIFTAYDDLNERELWISDGTAGGTSMLFDINNSGESDPRFFTEYDGKLFFAATDANNGRELWVTNGTSAGTSLLKNIANGGASSNPNEFVATSLGFFFTATSDLGELNLWYSDGTSGGTVVVQNLSAIDNGSSLRLIDVVGSKVYLHYFEFNGGTSALLTYDVDVNDSEALQTGLYPPVKVGNNYYYRNDDGNDSELYFNDGSKNSGQLIKDINPNGSSNPSDLFAVGARLFFVADDGTNGRELWVSDGTTAGTKMLKDLNTGPNGSFPGLYVIFGNKVYFVALNENGHRKMFVSDGTEGGTQQFLDLNQGSDDYSMSTSMVVRGTRMYFTAQDSDNDHQLWVTDGTVAGTQKLIPDIAPFADPLDGGGFLWEAGSNLLFAAYYTSIGNELYKLEVGGSEPSAVPENNLIAALKVFPNPAADQVTIALSTLQREDVSIAIQNLSGQTVQTIADRNYMAGNHHIPVDVSALPAGMYLVQVKAGDATQTIKLVK